MLSVLAWSTTFAVLVLVALLLIDLQPVKKRAPLNQAQQALLDGERLHRLLHALQQHRGMSVACLAGDEGFVPGTRERRRLVELLLSELEQQIGSQIVWCASEELAQTRTQWRELCLLLDAQPAALGVDETINRHSLLVARVLGWKSALARRCIAPVIGEELQPLLRTWSDTLPALTEVLGQARAVGSAVAVRGVCSTPERMRLVALSTRAEALMQQAIMDVPRLPGALPATERVVGLLGLLRGDAAMGTQFAPGAEAYFDEATGAIDAVYAWMKVCEDTLRHAMSGTP
ncbi:nitrate- and nitrite sensing domain-containing protein [Methyloversatilis thermotolerans]|uniref:nitrate- and nitrite sensing domain-containing protein n=1 Tax=Methyloversatilis thermotolerans TaxID=1346290 RepID=UPI00036D0C01|nr:nitrate- and nitrite sensing domain-containing protein [Methyloversatilis thermotolerans]